MARRTGTTPKLTYVGVSGRADRHLVQVALHRLRTQESAGRAIHPLPTRRRAELARLAGWRGLDAAVPRPPLPLGAWGKIRTCVDAVDERGRPRRHRAMAQYRDFDGQTRQFESTGRTPTDAANKLRQRLKERSDKGRDGDLTAMHRFSEATVLRLEKFIVMVEDGRRSAGSLDTYRGHLDNHVLPAIGQVRLGELTTPLVDKVLGRGTRRMSARPRRRAVAQCGVQCHEPGRPLPGQ